MRSRLLIATLTLLTALTASAWAKTIEGTPNKDDLVGTTGDAATPLESSRKMAAALADGRLIIATEDQHTGYGTSECVTDLVDDYLADLKIPDKETTCAAE